MADGGLGMQGIDLQAIADALAVSKRAAEMRATKEGWGYETRAARGGQKRFYTIALLPTDIQAALQRQRALASASVQSPAFRQGQQLARQFVIADQVDAAVRQRSTDRGAAAAAGLTGKARARMEAKLEVLARLKTFAQVRATGICAAMAEFCDAYNTGRLDVPADVREHVDAGLHPATLRRWKRDLKERGPAALAGSYGNRAGSGALDSTPALRDFAIGLLIDKPHIDGTALHLALETRFNGASIPSKRTVQRWLTRWKADNAEAFLAVANPDAWKNRHKVAFGNLDDGIVRANQLWQLDSTPGDIQLEDGRHVLIGAIDLATRRFKLHVAKTSTAAAVCSLLRRTILDWGVPEAVKVDNGADYASRHVERVLTGLQVEPRFSAPFAPWEKGNIERAFRTFSHDLLELLPGYSGHNVAEAQALRAADSFAERLFKKGTAATLKMTAADLQLFCDRWCEDLYAHRGHDGLKGETPFQRAASLRDAVRRIGDVRALDLLLAEAPDNNGLRVVSKKGIKLEKNWYIAPELAVLVRQPVQVLFDEADAGRVVVYHEGAFVCVAECPELLGVSRKEIAIEARTRQNAAIAEKRQELKALKRKANTGDIAWEVLARKREQAEALAAFPAPNVVHLTPALDAAAEAAAALDREPSPLDALGPTTEAHVAEVMQLLRDERTADDTNVSRFGRALRAMAAPENQIEQQWLKGYRQSSEFQGNWMVFESFGAGTFGLGDEFNALLPADAPFHQEQGAL